MKKTLSNIAMTLGLTAVLGSSTLLAEAFNRSKADIPFEFQIKKTTLPAGSYNVNYSPATKLLSFRNAANGRATAMLVNQIKSGVTIQPKLVFRYDGERYTVAEVWLDGGSYGPMKGKHERRDSERGMAATVRLISK